MSDGHNPDLAAWFAPFSGVATAAMGALGLWLAQRLLGKAAFEQAMNDRFKVLMTRTDDLHKEERAAWQSERDSWGAERLQLRGEIVNLKQVVATLTDTLRRNGVTGLPETERPDPIITIPGSESK